MYRIFTFGFDRGPRGRSKHRLAVRIQHRCHPPKPGPNASTVASLSESLNLNSVALEVQPETDEGTTLPPRVLRVQMNFQFGSHRNLARLAALGLVGAQLNLPFQSVHLIPRDAEDFARPHRRAVAQRQRQPQVIGKLGQQPPIFVLLEEALARAALSET